ncbi:MULTISPECIES: hypothetical protein [Haloarcula]|nr:MULTISPECIES: hypothetical protein [Halomicroarcula]
MSPPPTDDESTVSLTHRLLHLLKLLATTLAALAGLAKTLGWV